MPVGFPCGPCRAAVVLALATSVASCVGRPVATGALAPGEVAQLWIDPDVERSLTLGVGAAFTPPATDGRFRIDQVDTAGYSITWDVKGGRRDWSVKIGPEAQPEVVSSRILWALGYHQVPSFFVERWTAVKQDGQDVVRGGSRFRPHDDGLESRGSWSWERNPFVGTRPYGGLLVLMALLNSTDLKDSNNEIYAPVGGRREGAGLWYVVKDIGATLGETGVMDPRRGYLEGFEREPFVVGVEGERVRFAYHGWHQKLFSNVTVDDVKWMCARVLKISDRQWRDAFHAGGYDEEHTRRFVARITEKAEEGMRLR